MLPVADVRHLSQLQRELAEALVVEDWLRIGQVNRLIGARLERLRASGALDEYSVQQLEPLKRLHEQALHACARECERLRGVLQRHTDLGEGRQAYSLLDSVQGAS